MNYIVLDTETTNGMDDPLAYDIGWAVLNDDFEPIVTRSYVVAEIFLDKELMANAYFADKIEKYWEDIKSGKRKLCRLSTIAKQLRNDALYYGVESISAHNARFDVLSTRTTERYISNSKYRYLLPYGFEVWDTLKMAREVFGKDEDYINFCNENSYTISKNRPRFTAEVLYRYLTNNNDFQESHTGLEDVLIEKEILKACLTRNAEVDRRLYK